MKRRVFFFFFVVYIFLLCAANIGISAFFLFPSSFLFLSFFSPLSRKVGVSITPILWGFVDFPHHLQLRGIITRSLHDIDQSVRRATGQVLLNIVEIIRDDKVSATPWLVLMCERGMTDPVGELRGNAVSLVCAICEKCKELQRGRGAETAPAAAAAAAVAANGTDTSYQLFMDIYLLQCKLLPIATRLAEDKSPDVRLAVASHCDRLMGALGSHWIMVLIDLFQGLLTDEDEKVRTEAVYCIPRLVSKVFETSTTEMQSEVLSSIFMTTGKMVGDESPLVRVSLATSAGQLLVLITRPLDGGGQPWDDDARSSMTSESSEVTPNNSPTRGSPVRGGRVSDAAAAAAAPSGGRERLGSAGSVAPASRNPHQHFVDVHVLPVVQQLLHDPDPSVCSNALRAVANASHSINKSTVEDNDEVDFVPVLKEKQVMRLLPTLAHLAENDKWRVRRSAVEVVPALVKSTAGMKARAEIGKLVVGLLSDKVAQVRKAGEWGKRRKGEKKKKKGKKKKKS